MKIYDISQEVFSCEVYPGDPVPEKTELKSMQEGEVPLLARTPFPHLRERSER